MNLNLNIQESPADATESDFYAVTVPFISKNQ
jgi:hypothetical protein